MSTHKEKPVEKPAERPVDPAPEKPAAKGLTVGDLHALQIENAALKARLAVYEPPPPPVVPYPAWRYQRDATGQITAQVIVADAAADATLGKGWA